MNNNQNEQSVERDENATLVEDESLQELDPEILADDEIPSQLERQLDIYDLADPDDYEVQQELASGLEVRPEDARQQRVRVINQDQT